MSCSVASDGGSAEADSVVVDLLPGSPPMAQPVCTTTCAACHVSNEITLTKQADGSVAPTRSATPVPLLFCVPCHKTLCVPCFHALHAAPSPRAPPRPEHVVRLLPGGSAGAGAGLTVVRCGKQCGAVCLMQATTPAVPAACVSHEDTTAPCVVDMSSSSQDTWSSVTTLSAATSGSSAVAQPAAREWGGDTPGVVLAGIGAPPPLLPTPPCLPPHDAAGVGASPPPLPPSPSPPDDGWSGCVGLPATTPVASLPPVLAAAVRGLGSQPTLVPGWHCAACNTTVCHDCLRRSHILLPGSLTRWTSAHVVSPLVRRPDDAHTFTSYLRRDLLVTTYPKRRAMSASCEAGRHDDDGHSGADDVADAADHGKASRGVAPAKRRHTDTPAPEDNPVVRGWLSWFTRVVLPW